MKLIKLFLLTGICLLMNTISNAQEKLYISEEGVYKFFRVNVAATNWNIKPLDSQSRSATGIYLNNEGKIISGFQKKTLGFTIHDAFYFDMSFGKMNQDARIAHNGEVESKLSININMGYLGLAGYRTERWAALGGLDFRFFNYSVGGSDLPNVNGSLFYASTPIVLRGEYGFSKSNPNVRAILSVWTTRSYAHYEKTASTKAPYHAVRLELPLTGKGRFWLFAQYVNTKQLGEDTHMFYPARVATFNQYMVGLRVGNLP